MIKNFFSNYRKANEYDKLVKTIESLYETKKEKLLLLHREGIAFGIEVLIAEINTLAYALNRQQINKDDIPGTLEYYPKNK